MYRLVSINKNRVMMYRLVSINKNRVMMYRLVSINKNRVMMYRSTLGYDIQLVIRTVLFLACLKNREYYTSKLHVRVVFMGSARDFPLQNSSETIPKI